ncbi:MAG: hypothetical protein Q8K78_11335, partial [Planctomycetaceae bacterium]|nr:hypothetical protein [Planctomycetaceae bacterium]
MKRYGLILMVCSIIWCRAPQTAEAQFELLRDLFGARKATPRVFAGEAQIEEARRAAERGNVKESLELVRAAMSKGAAQTPFNDPIGQSVAGRLIALSHRWEEQQADAATVAAVLREIVLPTERPTEIWPYALSWQPESRPWSPVETRLSKPQSVAAEMVKWSVRAKLTAPVRERLQSVLKAADTQALAEVVAVQLAVAEHDAVTANRTLESLRTTAGKSSMVDEWRLHAVTAALDDPQSQFAGLQLLEAVLESIGKADQSPLSESRFAIWMRAVPLYFQLNRPDDAVRIAVAAVNEPVSAQRYGKEFGELIQQLQR